MTGEPGFCVPDPQIPQSAPHSTQDGLTEDSGLIESFLWLGVTLIQLEHVDWTLNMRADVN